MDGKVYAAIDLKSFYASVECVERGLDPLRTNLVVADRERTEKTICLAVTPSLKSCGIPGRPRLFEVVEKVKEINAIRRMQTPNRQFRGASCDGEELRLHPEMQLDYIVAPPRMAKYVEYSTFIYSIYSRFIAPEDIHVYSIDEVFLDLSGYGRIYRLTPRQLVQKMIHQVLEETGITATAGIGSNLYLCKIAMDIMAKRIPADENGVRIAQLDEISYRESLWEHRPITDFWRIGRGYARKLEKYGIYTMGDVAWRSIEDENLLYRLFGVNAELLIDHAWGYENCRMEDIKNYRPKSSSLSVGQVLKEPYSAEKARIIIREMAEGLALDMVAKGLCSDQITLYIGYDVENLLDPARRAQYSGETVADHYGRLTPKPAGGSVRLNGHTASSERIIHAALSIFDEVTDPSLLIRRINIGAGYVMEEDKAHRQSKAEQLDLFTDYEALEAARRQEERERAKEKHMQRTMIQIREKFGKNAILRGTSYLEGATGIERNGQIGGHRA